jgi:hypothetical protein
MFDTFIIIIIVVVVVVAASLLRSVDGWTLLLCSNFVHKQCTVALDLEETVAIEFKM